MKNVMVLRVYENGNGTSSYQNGKGTSSHENGNGILSV
jgi:hypothetical protein